MRYSDYETALSPARLSRYSNACGGDKNKALTLYRHNVKLCQKFYGVLSLFEVVLRNAINEHYKQYFVDCDWIKTQMQPGGMLENCPQAAEVGNHITRLINAGKYTHDRLVSSVSFGFWTYLFNKQPFRKGGQTLLAIFPKRSRGLGRKAIYNELMAIKAFRNRIAHHEPICFDQYGNKDVIFAQNNYDQILKYIDFLKYNKNELFFGLDILPDKTIAKINSYGCSLEMSPGAKINRLGSASAGTIGYRAKNSSGDVGIVTAGHVPHDTSMFMEFGGEVLGLPTKCKLSDNVDGAFIPYDDTFSFTYVTKYGKASILTTLGTGFKAGAAIKFEGAKTAAVESGTINNPSTDAHLMFKEGGETVYVTIKDCISVNVYTQVGDSGGLCYLTTNKPIGILSGGDGSIAYMCKISNINKDFGLTMY